MNLVTLKAEATEILIEYSNGLVESRAFGRKYTRRLMNDNMRVHYLYGIIDGVFEDGGIFYIGNTVATEDYILTTMEMLRHYRGIYRNIDLATVDIIHDDTPTPTPTPSNTDFIRTGAEAVIAGVNTITFSSPLANDGYILDCWVVLTDGDIQHNLDDSNHTTAGFKVNGVISDGSLYYTAILKI